MLLGRSNKRLSRLGLAGLLILLLGSAPLAVTRGEQSDPNQGAFTAEPLPSSAFGPAISAPDFVAAAHGRHEQPTTPAPSELAIELPRMPGIVTVQRTLSAGDTSEDWEFDVVYPDGQPRDFSIAVPEEVEIERGGQQSFAVIIDGRDVPLGAARSATLLLTGKADGDDDDDYGDNTVVYPRHRGSGASERSGRNTHHDDDDDDDEHPEHGGDDKEERTLTVPVSFVRAQAVIEITSACEPLVIVRGEQSACTVTMTNTGAADADVALLSKLPRQLRLVRGSVAGGKAIGRDRIIYKGVIPGRAGSGVSAAVDPSGGPAAYVSLGLLGIEPLAGVGDETIHNVTVPEFTFAGQRYTSLGIVSNGYLVLGGGDASTIAPLNTQLPDSALPNGVLAPFWTNLDPSLGGAVRVATVTDGFSRWLVVDYNRVPNSGQPEAVNSFQIWINLNLPDTISFIYGPAVTAGAAGLLTVGAESQDGSSGTTIYYNGVGAAPAPGRPVGTYSVAVTAAPGQPSSYTVRFNAGAHSRGPFVSYSFLRSNAFEGIAVARLAGEVVKKK